MADYKTLHGTNIDTVSSDPSNPVIGQVWYNSTSQTLKGLTSNPAGSWATGNNMNTARSALGGAGATKDAALGFGGSPPPAPNAKAITESYNGSSWTEVSDFNTARAYVAGAGTYTSAVASGGDQLSGTSESWNGTCWSNITSSNNPQPAKGSAGADNENALYFGGAPSGNTALNEHWNGSAWTELADLNSARADLAGVGKTYTAAIAASGQQNPPNFSALAESWNGSAWTEVGDLNTGRRYSSGDGTSTSGLVYGGESAAPAIIANAETWNGTAWAEVGDLNTARREGPLGGAGSGNTNALMFGGNTGSDSNATEEFEAPLKSTVSFDAS